MYITVQSRVQRVHPVTVSQCIRSVAVLSSPATSCHLKLEHQLHICRRRLQDATLLTCRRSGKANLHWAGSETWLCGFESCTSRSGDCKAAKSGPSCSARPPADIQIKCAGPCMAMAIQQTCNRLGRMQIRGGRSGCCPSVF